MPEAVTIAGFAGSLRKGSYNKLLLRNAVELAQDDVRLVPIDIGDIPLYNADLDGPPPPAVTRLREMIRMADALLIVTPEYNNSMSGVTKNVIDWASRPPDDSCLEDKPVGLAGCSTSHFGTVRAKLALLPTLTTTGMRVLDDPMLHVARANTKFDEAGMLTDEDIKKDLRELLVALAAWSRRLKKKT